MNEKQMTLGRDWQGENVAGWYWSEKYDGCRAYWDGSKLWTRGGNIIHAPEWLTKPLPAAMHLDCEVWYGQGEFEAARLSVQYGKFAEDAKLVVFDAPRAGGDWHERMLAAAISIRPKTGIGPVICCRNGVIIRQSDVAYHFSKVKEIDGEGLVLRKPGIGYEIGRTKNTLKVKDILYI